MTTAISDHANVESIPVARLKANPRNARTHSAKQISQIAASIARFGFLVPIISDDAGFIVAGHGRYEASKLLGLIEVPVIEVQFLTDADRRAFALAENRIAELSGWDDDLLAKELSFLFEDGYDLSITGFSLSDMDFSIGDDVSTKEEAVELPDLSVAAVSRLYDLWLIGPHRLYCGDSTKLETYERLLGEERADLVFCDGPYNVRIDGHVSGNGKTHHREFSAASGELSAGEFTTFLRNAFRLCARFSTNGSIHYQCMDWRHIREILDAADGIYSQFKQLLVWNKGVGGQGAFYRSQYELVFVFKNGSASHQNHFGLGETGRYRTNVLDYAGANSFHKGRLRDLADHPTVKPTALVADLLLDCSSRGDLVLDAFAGTATTLLAAHKTHRRGAAIEIDPIYVDTALRRLAQSTGLEIRHEDGRTFEEVVHDRLDDETDR